MRNKKLPMVEDFATNQTMKTQPRLIITPRSNRVDIEALMDHLFATTDLERSYRINMNIIGIDGRPSVMNLLQDFKSNGWCSEPM